MFKNYVVTLLGRFSSAISTLVTLPALLQILGPKEYVYVAFASVVQGYANVLDAGLSSASSAQIARFSGNNSFAKSLMVQVTKNACIKFAKYSPILLLVIVLVAQKSVKDVDNGYEKLFIICSILLIDAFASALLRIQYAALQGLGKHMHANTIHTGNVLLRAIAALAAAYYLGKIETIYICQTFITLYFLIVCFNEYRKLEIQGDEPHAHPDGRSIDFLMSSWFTSTTTELTTIAIMIAVINSLPYIILGNFGKADEINHFFLAVSFGSVLATLQGAFLSIMIPELSHQLANLQRNNIDETFEKFSGKIALLSFFVAGLIYGLAEDVIRLWINKPGIDLLLLSELLRWQLISSAFASLTIVPYALSIPKGKTRIQLVGVAIYLIADILILPAVRIFGDIKIFMMSASVLGALFSFFYFIASSRYVLEFSVKRAMMRSMLVPAGCTVGAIVLGKIISSGIKDSELYLRLLIHGSMYAVTYFMIFYVLDLSHKKIM